MTAVSCFRQPNGLFLERPYGGFLVLAADQTFGGFLTPAADQTFDGFLSPAAESGHRDYSCFSHALSLIFV